MADSGSWLQDARQYLNEVQAEGKKITWPAQKEALAGAAGVVIIVIIFAVFLATVDFGLGMLLRAVLE